MSKSYPIDSDFIVRESSCPMPSTCKGRYSRVALIEVDQGVTEVSRIDTRAKGVRSIVWVAEKLHVGQTERGAAQRALAEAQEEADALNRRQASRRKRAATIAAKRAAREALEAAPALDALALAT